MPHVTYYHISCIHINNNTPNYVCTAMYVYFITTLSHYELSYKEFKLALLFSLLICSIFLSSLGITTYVSRNTSNCLLQVYDQKVVLKYVLIGVKVEVPLICFSC